MGANLGYAIPTVGDPGPGWANEIRDALQRIEDAAPVVVGLPAAGSATGKDKAAFGAAVTTALSRSGAVEIELPGGRLDVGDYDGLVLPPYSPGSAVLHFKGNASVGTELFFSVDQGSGKHPVTLGGTEYQLYFHTFENVRFVGPGDIAGVAKGSPPVNTIGGGPTLMDGPQLGSRMKLIDGNCYGFRSGVEMMGNHSVMRDWNCQGNYDGIRFANAFNNAGDVLLDNCDLSGNNRSSIACSNTTTASFVMRGGHLGFGPYPVYFEPGRTGSSGLAMGGCLFDHTSFEEIGNSFFYDPDHMARCESVKFIECGNFSRDHATYGITSVTTNPGFYVRDWSKVSFEGGFPLGVADGALFDITNTLKMRTDDWKESYDASVTAGRSWILYGGVGSTPEVYLGVAGENWYGRAAQNDTAATVTAGMVVELGGATNGVRPRRFYGGANTGKVTGIALNTVSTSARDLVVIVKLSYSVPVLVDSAPSSAFQIMASTVTAGKATGVVYDGTSTSLGGRPLLGSTFFGAVPTGGGLVSCSVDIA